jgi:hypothetical protein
MRRAYRKRAVAIAIALILVFFVCEFIIKPLAN